MTDSRSTSDRKVSRMALACYLWSTGFKIKSQRWHEVPRVGADPMQVCTWWFEGQEGLDEAIRLYEDGQARVEPGDFFNDVTKFKRMVYEIR